MMRHQANSRILRLFNASPAGSAEIELLQREDSERWERLRRNAVRFMRDTGEQDVANLLESLAFEI